MKKKVTITAVVIICILLVVAVALSANRAGGEIGFEATINSVENGVAYATINKQDAGFLAPKLPGNIEFNTSDLDVKLQAGDEISGCYLSGTINGSSVRVVDVTIKGNASQGINDLISLNEVSDYITEKGYTSKDFEESLMGRFREDIIRSWGASDLLFSGINADGWYLDDDKNRGISLTSYVYNQCGWDFGRLGAQGLYNISTRTSSPKPGDLVFFTGTYDTPGISHVGIYVGDGWMLHCGDPISYANLNTSYWQSHFYA